MFNERSILQNDIDSFPGRWLGGLSLIIAPILLVISALLRIQYNFFFPDQLAAYDTHPTLMLISYSLFLIGMILLFPAILILVQLISKKATSRSLGWFISNCWFICKGIPLGSRSLRFSNCRN